LTRAMSKKTASAIGALLCAAAATTTAEAAFPGGEAPVTWTFSESGKYSDETPYKLQHKYFVDLAQGKTLLQIYTPDGNVRNRLTIGTTTYLFDHLDQKVVDQIDVCNILTKTAAESNSTAQCDFTAEDNAGYKALAQEHVTPSRCQVLEGAEADKPYTPGAKYLNTDASGNKVYQVGDEPDNTYVETAGGKPLYLGDFIVSSVQAGPIDPTKFIVPDACLPALDTAGDSGSSGFSLPVRDDSADFVSYGDCPPVLTQTKWSPDKVDFGDRPWHQNWVRWDNNPSKYMEPSHPSHNEMDKIQDKGIPHHRLWGTIWCGRNNEFNAYSRYASESSSAIWPGKAKGVIGFGCAGESPVDETKGGVRVQYEHMYGVPGKAVKAGPLVPRTWVHGQIRPHLPKALKDNYIPLTYNTFMHGTTDYLMWGKRLTKPHPYSGSMCGAGICEPQRLTRCRAATNFQDPVYMFNNRGLEATINKQYFDSSNAPYTLVRNDWNDEQGKQKYHLDNPNGSIVSEDICRQHDFSPIANSDWAPCTADGLVEFQFQRQARWFGAPNNLAMLLSSKHYVHANWPIILFANHGPACPCFNLFVDCQQYKGVKCLNFLLKWKLKYAYKYVTTDWEGFRLTGLQARDDLGKETVCIALRLPGEGIDNTKNDRIGNGKCDCDLNNDYHGYDGGDCCMKTNPFIPDNALCKQPGCHEDHVTCPKLCVHVWNQDNWATEGWNEGNGVGPDGQPCVTKQNILDDASIIPPGCPSYPFNAQVADSNNPETPWYQFPCTSGPDCYAGGSWPGRARDQSQWVTWGNQGDAY